MPDTLAVRLVLLASSCWLAFGCKKSDDNADAAKADDGKSAEQPASDDGGSAEQPKGDPSNTVVLADPSRESLMVGFGDQLVFTVEDILGSKWDMLALGTGAPELIAVDMGGAAELESDGKAVYWLHSDRGEDDMVTKTSLWSISPEGEGWGAPKLLSDALPFDERSGAHDLIFTDAYVYASVGHQIVRVAKGGGELEPVLETKDFLGQVSASGTSVYWAEFDDDFKATVSRAEEGAFDAPERVNDPAGLPAKALAATPEGLYWSEVDGGKTSLMWRKLGGEIERVSDPLEGQEIDRIIPADGFLALDVSWGVGRWTPGSAEIELWGGRGGGPPQRDVTVAKNSMIWKMGGKVVTTEGAPFLEARGFVSLPGNALVFYQDKPKGE